jgi:hypothetical protein
MTITSFHYIVTTLGVEAQGSNGAFPAPRELFKHSSWIPLDWFSYFNFRSGMIINTIEIAFEPGL